MKNHVVRIEEAALGSVLGERFGHSDSRETMDGRIPAPVGKSWQL